MVPDPPMARTPRHHLAFLTQPDCLQHMYMLCMVEAGHGANMEVEKKIDHVLGGSKGGDDQSLGLPNSSHEAGYPFSLGQLTIVGRTPPRGG